MTTATSLLTDEQAAWVEYHTGLVRVIAWKVARSVGGRYLSIDELRSAGHEGLVQAATRYVPGGPASFATYARYRVCGAMIDALRKLPPWSHRSIAQLADDGPSHEQALVVTEEHSRVWAMVATLEPLERELIKAVYVEDRAMAELARALGVSKATISRRHAKAIKCLKKRILARDWAESRVITSIGATEK